MIRLELGQNNHSVSVRTLYSLCLGGELSRKLTHHGDTENTEQAQRNSISSIKDLPDRTSGRNPFIHSSENAPLRRQTRRHRHPRFGALRRTRCGGRLCKCHLSSQCRRRGEFLGSS